MDADAATELIDAQARNRGLLRLLVRGVTKAKAKAVLLWHGTHDMVRLWPYPLSNGLWFLPERSRPGSHTGSR